MKTDHKEIRERLDAAKRHLLNIPTFEKFISDIDKLLDELEEKDKEIERLKVCECGDTMECPGCGERSDGVSGE